MLRLQSPQTWVSLEDDSPYGIAPRGAFQGPFGWSSDAGCASLYVLLLLPNCSSERKGSATLRTGVLLAARPPFATI